MIRVEEVVFNGVKKWMIRGVLIFCVCVVVKSIVFVMNVYDVGMLLSCNLFFMYVNLYLDV